MPLVSVIVPTFNAGDALIETIRSALEQSFREIEIVIVDDGSVDESAVAILRRFGPDPERAETLWRQRNPSSTGACGFSFWTGDDRPLQYFYQPNRGMGTARNRGLQIARGDFVAFLEPEYIWEKDHLRHQIEFLLERPDTWISHGRVLSFLKPASRNGKRKKAPLPMSFAEVVAGTGICASAIVMRRRCLETHGCFDENLPSCEDYDLWIRIAAHVPIYQVTESIVYMKRIPAVPSWSLDRYRVYALEKAFQSGHLNSEQRRRVAEEMVGRCDTLVDGYRKRNNTERANFYDRKKKKFELEVAKLRTNGAAQHARVAERDRSLYEEGDLSPTGSY